MLLKEHLERITFNAAALQKPKKKPSVLRRSLTAVFLTVSLGAGFLGYFGQTVQTQGGQLPEESITETVEVLPQQPQPAAEEETVIARPVAQPYVSPVAGVEMSQRSLTAGEKKLVKQMFGDGFDVSGVRLHFFEKDRGQTTSDTVWGRASDIEFYGLKHLSTDYSKADAYNFGSFVHEMTALWQMRQGQEWKHGEAEGYEYPLKEEFSFDDYGPKQQRAILEDYALRFLHPDRQSYWLPKQYEDDNIDTDPLLKTLVESKFPQAEQARIANANVVNRPLTAGEAQLLSSIFGDGIDTAQLKVSLHPQEYSDIVGSVEDDHRADFWGPKESSRDFSTEKDAERFGTFIHEFTHIWQRHTGWQYTRENDSTAKDKYAFQIGANSKFTNYSVEQQAAMMEDYARYYLHPAKKLYYLDDHYEGAALQQKLVELKKVVEDHFPGARATREAYEAKQRANTPVAAAQHRRIQTFG